LRGPTEDAPVACLLRCLSGEGVDRLIFAERVHMWHVIAQAGLASTGVEFTESLSLLVAGLVGLVWLSAGLIAFMALHHYWSQTHTRVPEAPPTLWTTTRRRNEVALDKSNSFSQGESEGDGEQPTQIHGGDAPAAS